MRIFKSDGRYKLYDRGFRHIIEFSWNGIEDRRLYRAFLKEFDTMYGPYRHCDIEKNTQVWNKQWRFEANAKAKRRRIYLKEESGLSMALLKIGAQNGS